jgi:hypothetical protein
MEMMMKNKWKNSRLVVRQDKAESYILISLIAFAVTVIFTRAFLQLTGFPQLGNNVLHIAHALWGGLFLIVAVYLPLTIANRWAIKASALLSGIGIGLFIDEIGKFITQANDYFFPSALPLIYGFILLNVFVYVYFRRPRRDSPIDAMYYALAGLHDALDGSLDEDEACRIKDQLAIAKQSDQDEIVSLANAISAFLSQEKQHLSTSKDIFWKQIKIRAAAFGQRAGRNTHRHIISGMLVLWTIFVIGYIAVLVQGDSNINFQVLQWRGVLIGIQYVIGGSMIAALLAWLTGKEDTGLKIAVGGVLLSLIAFQTLYFYISQFSAITATLLQFLFLQILLAYRRWYLEGETRFERITS